MRNSCTLLCWLFLAVSLQTLAAQDQTSDIDIQNRRAEIRGALLRYTPLGSSPQDVLVFIKDRLLRKDSSIPVLENHPAVGETAEHSKNRGVKSIRLSLGQYLAHPEIVFFTVPVVLEKETIAQWAFDERGKLIEIFVDKKQAAY